jgi:calcineurin-like phosphoesterase
MWCNGVFWRGLAGPLFARFSLGHEQILPKQTAYLTDVGMTGVIDSIIGADKKAIIENFLTQRPVKHEVAEGDTVFNALLLETDKKTGLAKSIERIQIRPVSV